MTTINKEIFKTYDIRGIVGKTLTEEVCYAVGFHFGEFLKSQNQTIITIGRDGRLSGPSLIKSLSAGLVDAGINITDIGMVTTPMVYVAAKMHTNGNGICITGSHNPPDYNGLKIMFDNKPFFAEKLQELYQSITTKEVVKSQTPGTVTPLDFSNEYLTFLKNDITIKKPLKIILDFGNGVGGAIGPKAFDLFDGEVISLYDEVDGTFPNHHPDPAEPKNMQDLIAAVKEHKADIGFGFDGDADRVGVVSSKGEIIFPDTQMMVIIKDVLQKHPNSKIIYDVKCTQNLKGWITKHRGEPVMWKTGHSVIKTKLKELNSPFSGELSGHFFFGDRLFGFDDGIYAALRILEILSAQDDSQTIWDELPTSEFTPELHWKFNEGEHYKAMQEIANSCKFDDAEAIHTIDGLRVEYADGFGLVRPSNTTPVLTMRFEGTSSEALERIKQSFKDKMAHFNSATYPY